RRDAMVDGSGATAGSQQHRADRTMNKTTCCVALILLTALCGRSYADPAGAPARAASTPAPARAAAPPPPPVDAYHIGVDDLLQVSVWRNPELSVTVPVRPDGRISLPLVGDVVAGGRTAEQVAADVKEHLAAYIRDPQVAVILTELRSHEYLSRVRVTGAVRQPVSIAFRQGMTVLDAVLAAGGLPDFAPAHRPPHHCTARARPKPP